jgi:signal transduction histidine kinase
MAIAASMGGGLALNLAMAFSTAAFWNVLLTVFAAALHRARLFRLICIFGDLVIAMALFYLSDGSQGTLPWAGVLPIISAALYFPALGGLLVAGASLLAQGALEFSTWEPVTLALFLATMLPFYAGLGIGLGLIALRLSRRLEQNQRSQASIKRAGERTERERSRLVYKLIASMSASLNYQRVLETALDAGGSALSGENGPDERLVSAVLLYQTSEGGETILRVGSARGFTQADLRISLPGAAGLVGQTIDEAEPKLTRMVSKDPELNRVVALHNCTAAYTIPLRSGLDTYGVLLFAHPEPEYFKADRREILELIGSQAMVSIQNARLYHDLEQEKERITDIQEDARKKLARDLHDGPTQSVAALAMRTNFARRLIEKDTSAAAEELYKIEELARRTTKEIRHMLFTLRPLVLESHGLVAALASMAEKMRETFGQIVLIDADNELVDQIELNKQGIIFYIAEEAINNARKHAQANHTWVRLKDAGQDLLMLEIEDDGVGFSIETINSNYENRGSLGLVNMRERAELVNGLMQIDTAPERGTRIRILIPLSDDAADRLRRGP